MEGAGESAPPKPRSLPIRPLWVLAVVIRLVLLYGSEAIQSTIASRIEVATPFSSFKVLREGLFLFKHGLPLYDGGVFVQAPLLLPVFKVIPPVAFPIVFVAFDLLIAFGLSRIAVYKHNRDLACGLIPEVVVVDTEVQQMKQKSHITQAVNSAQLSGAFSKHPDLGIAPDSAQQQIPSVNIMGTTPTEADKADVQDGDEPLDPENTSKDGNGIPKSASFDGLSKRLLQKSSSNNALLLASQEPSANGPSSSLFKSSSMFSFADEFYPSEVLGDRYVPVYLRFEPSDIGAIYLLNPYSILICVGNSMSVVENLLIVSSMVFAIYNQLIISLATLMFAVHMTVYPIVFFLPVFALYNPRYKSRDLTKAIIIAETILTVYTALSFYLVGDWSFIKGCYIRLFSIRDLTPNIGIYWYFLVEVFEQFRTFFLSVFQLASFMFLIPIGIVYKEHPIFAVIALQIVLCVFKSYPSIGDITLYLALIPVYREMFTYMSQVFVIVNIFIFVTFLEPLFYYLWIYAGGNANFFYAITLVLVLGQCLLLLDLGGALRRRVWDINNPELRRARVEVCRL